MTQRGNDSSAANVAWLACVAFAAAFAALVAVGVAILRRFSR